MGLLSIKLSAGLVLLGCLPVVASLLPLSQKTPVEVPDPVRDLFSDKNALVGRLTYRPERGYLDDLLKALNIKINSQVLVFSKTSLQSDFVSAKNPRAIFFNEHTYVGYIPGAPLIEIMSVSPSHGANFYTIENKLPSRRSKSAFPLPKLDPDETNCTRCHGNRSDSFSPILFSRSSVTAPSGYPRVETRSPLITIDSPIEERWGGWYVTGTHGNQLHLGSEFVEATDTKFKIDSKKGANLVDLSKKVVLAKYPTRHSDIVALMVMEHQMDVQNALSSAQLTLRSTFKEPELAFVQGSDQNSTRLLNRAVEICEPLIDRLFSKDEAQLKDSFKGTTSFATDYSASWPKSKSGDSLGQLDLHTRLYRWKVSPMISSVAFQSLPPIGRQVVYRRLRKALTTDQWDRFYPDLKRLDKEQLLNILAETIPEFQSVR